MSVRPTARELHHEHAFERAWDRKLNALREHEASVRQLEEAKWQRRVLPLLPSVREVPSDFEGCVW